MSVAALAFAATACDDKKEDLGAPQITLNPSEISVGKAGTTTTIELTATRKVDFCFADERERFS